MPGSFFSRDRHSGFYNTIIRFQSWDLCSPDGSILQLSRLSAPSFALQRWLSRSCGAGARASAWTLVLLEVR